MPAILLPGCVLFPRPFHAPEYAVPSEILTCRRDVGAVAVNGGGGMECPRCGADNAEDTQHCCLHKYPSTAKSHTAAFPAQEAPAWLGCPPPAADAGFLQPPPLSRMAAPPAGADAG